MGYFLTLSLLLIHGYLVLLILAYWPFPNIAIAGPIIVAQWCLSPTIGDLRPLLISHHQSLLVNGHRAIIQQPAQVSESKASTFSSLSSTTGATGAGAASVVGPTEPPSKLNNSLGAMVAGLELVTPMVTISSSY